MSLIELQKQHIRDRKREIENIKTNEIDREKRSIEVVKQRMEDQRGRIRRLRDRKKDRSSYFADRIRNASSSSSKRSLREAKKGEMESIARDIAWEKKRLDGMRDDVRRYRDQIKRHKEKIATKRKLIASARETIKSLR